MNDITAKRRETHRERILRLVKTAAPDWVPCSVLASFSRNHTARVSELRRKGYDIECRVTDDKTGATEYRLISEGNPKNRQVTCHIEVIGVDAADNGIPTDAPEWLHEMAADPTINPLAKVTVQHAFDCPGERVGQQTIECQIPMSFTAYKGDKLVVTWKFNDYAD